MFFVPIINTTSDQWEGKKLAYFTGQYVYQMVKVPYLSDI